MQHTQIRAAARAFVAACYPSFDDLQLDPALLDRSAAIVARLLDGWLVRVSVVAGMAVCSVVVGLDGAARSPTADDLEVGRAAMLGALAWVPASVDDPPALLVRPAPADRCAA